MGSVQETFEESSAVEVIDDLDEVTRAQISGFVRDLMFPGRKKVDVETVVGALHRLRAIHGEDVVDAFIAQEQSRLHLKEESKPVRRSLVEEDAVQAIDLVPVEFTHAEIDDLELPAEITQEFLKKIQDLVGKYRKPKQFAAAVQDFRSFVGSNDAGKIDVAKAFAVALKAGFFNEDHITEEQVQKTLKALYKAEQSGGVDSAFEVSKWDIIEAAKLHKLEAYKVPHANSGVIRWGILADGVRMWQDVEDNLGEETLAEFFERHHVFEEERTYKGTLCYEDIVAAAWRFEREHERRPVTKDGLIEEEPLAGTGLTWNAVNEALRKGRFGLPGGENLRGLLRQVGPPQEKDPNFILTHALIVKLAKDKGGAVTILGTSPIPYFMDKGRKLSWNAIHLASLSGRYYLPLGRGLSDILNASGLDRHLYQGVLTHAKIVESARLELEHTGRLPVNTDVNPIQYGELKGTGLTWAAVSQALISGYHTLPGGESLYQLLEDHGLKGRLFHGVLTHQIISEAARLEFEATGRRPVYSDPNPVQYGELKGTGLTWAAVSQALEGGFHGLPGGQKMIALFEEAKIPKKRLTKDYILKLARKHVRDNNGRRPNHGTKGVVENTYGYQDLTWREIDEGLRVDRYKIGKRISLAKFLDEANIKSNMYDGEVTIDEIVRSAKSEYRTTKKRSGGVEGRWPSKEDKGDIQFGPLKGRGLSWANIDDALRRGYHGLESGRTLAQVLEDHTAKEAKKCFEGTITDEQIIASAVLEHFYLRSLGGRKLWPSKLDQGEIERGPLAGTGLTWLDVNNALKRGSHGLDQKGRSLSSLLKPVKERIKMVEKDVFQQVDLAKIEEWIPGMTAA